MAGLSQPTFFPIGALDNPIMQPNVGMGGAAAALPTTITPAPSAPRFLPSDLITPGTGSNISAVQPFLNEGLRQAQELFLRQSPQSHPPR